MMAMSPAATPRAQEFLVQSGRGGAEDVGGVEDVLDGLGLQPPGISQQAFGFLAGLLARPGQRLGPGMAACLPEQAHGLLDQLAGQSDIWMVFHQQVQGVGTKIGHHTGRVPQPHGPLTGGQQPLEEVVHGQIARGAGQDFLAAPDRLADQLHDGGRLAGARGPVDQGHVARGQSEPHGFLLRVVEPPIEGWLVSLAVELRRLLTQQDVPQFSQAFRPRLSCPLQGGPLSLHGHFIG